MKSLKAYLAFFRLRMINTFQYRTAAWAGVFTQFFWGFMEIQLYRAFYAEHAAAFPMTLDALVSYIWLRQAFLAMLSTWIFEKELFSIVLDGNIAYELCRPVSVYGMWFTRTAAVRLSRAAMRCWPILLVAFLLPDPWGMNLPAGPVAFAAFLLSMILGLCLASALALIVYFSCFFTISADGIRAVFTPLSDFLSGGIIPLPFMPAWLIPFVQYAPFSSILSTPLRIYSGDISGAALTEALLLQAFWLAALVAIGWFMQKKGLKKLCVQGG